MFRSTNTRSHRLRGTAVLALGAVLAAGVTVHAAFSRTAATPASHQTASAAPARPATQGALPSPVPSLQPLISPLPSPGIRQDVQQLRADVRALRGNAARTLDETLFPRRFNTIARTVPAQIVPSPDFAADHTIFLVGSEFDFENELNSLEMPNLWVSHDSGSSWQMLATNRDGYLGGQILLPPSYPADPAIFADNGYGIQESTDGGRHFLTVFPTVSAPGAMDPTSPVGDARILIGGNPALVYHAGTRSVTPGPPIPPSILIQSLSYVGDGAHVVAAGQLPSTDNATTTGGAVEVVESCDGAACAETYRSPNGATPTVVVSPTASTDHTVYVTEAQLLRSTDGGAAFITMPTRSEITGSLVTVDLGPSFSTTQEMVVETVDFGFHLHLYRSTDGGQTVTELPHTGIRSSNLLMATTVLPDDEIMGGNWDLAFPFNVGGLVCSTDHGQSFSGTC